MRYWNGHCWQDRCDACGRNVERCPHVCGYFASPITVSAEELEAARASPLNLVESLVPKPDVAAEDRHAAYVLGFDLGAEPLSSSFVVEPRCPNGHGLNCNCEAARAERLCVNRDVQAKVVDFGVNPKREALEAAGFNFDSDEYRRARAAFEPGEEE